MSAARSFAVKGVNGPAFESANRILDESRLVQRVGVNGDLHVKFVRDPETGVDGRGVRAPVFVQFEPDGSGADLFAQRLRRGAIALAKEAEVHRVFVGGFQHAVEVPDAGCAGGGVSARRGTRAAPK